MATFMPGRLAFIFAPKPAQYSWPPLAGWRRAVADKDGTCYAPTMAPVFPRRLFISAGLVCSVAGCSREPRDTSHIPTLAAELSTLERRLGGRVGVYAFSPTLPGAPQLAHRADERFAMCSTFKWALAARVLGMSDRGELGLAESVPLSQAALQEHAPAARALFERGRRSMSLEACCEAAVTVSDNTATNLLLARVGGPQGLTTYFRSSGDEVTRLDRMEPELNTNLPSDVRDTTTPRAMARVLALSLTGELLSPRSREQLGAWLVACSTGDDRLRAGFPSHLRVGDKTGTGNNGACNDVAVVWRSNGKPLIVASYFSGSQAPLADLLRGHRRVGQLVAGLL